MPQTRYLALLRGINVGGSNVIRMSDLRKCFESMGLDDVVTYIQSGNVLFSSEEKSLPKLELRIQEGLSIRFRYRSLVVLVTQKQLKAVVEDAPRGFGESPDKYRYDVIFLKAPMTAKETMQSVTTKPGVDTAQVGKGALYFSRLDARASQSHLPKIIRKSVYKFMTIRNWNTTTKLLEMMGKGQ
jgi:uncharacterized protein (DUF1697 family)